MIIIQKSVGEQTDLLVLALFLGRQQQLIKLSLPLIVTFLSVVESSTDV